MFKWVFHFLAYIYFAVFSTTEVVSVYVVVSSLLTYSAKVFKFKI